MPLKNKKQGMGSGGLWKPLMEIIVGAKILKDWGLLLNVISFKPLEGGKINLVGWKIY